MINYLTIEKKLYEKWKINIPFFWIPLDDPIDVNLNNEICYFNYTKLKENYDIKIIENFIQTKNETIIVLNDFNEKFTLEKIEIEKISGSDKFITNKNGDWVIYITHEDTITFAGISLISKLKEWVDFEKMKNPWEK
ncbi:hypothetical protein [Chishuiella sp.]|uniref:hypothetical protein n=1 Tax=Chishuiella sp. TaxID=1969467 RepID=UPI0028A6600E|nr:hypothetical protein [Chishuiella sp.]